MPLDLIGLPWFLGRFILRTLANPKCSADAVLLLADALDETAQELPARAGEESIYLAPCIRVAESLRAAAPAYAQPGGKPLGDFEGTLTP